MSAPVQEPTDGGAVHYQISITARQAAAFFVALLVALGLSFFFGMKTGAAAKKAGDPVSRLAAASDLAVPTAIPIEEPAEKRDDDRKLGFEKTKAVPTERPEKASVSTPPKPAEEPTAVPEPTAAAPARPTVEPKPAATKVPEKPTPKPAEKVAEKPGAAEKAAPRKDVWYLQVYATKSVEGAEKLSERLKQAKLKVDVSTDPSGSGYYRVRVGPYPDKARAEAARKKVLEVDKSLKDSKLIHP